MKTIGAILVTAALVCGVGCARRDWIDRTLVTVDVTGTWSGFLKGTSLGGSREVTFDVRAGRKPASAFLLELIARL